MKRDVSLSTPRSLRQNLTLSLDSTLLNSKKLVLFSLSFSVAPYFQLKKTSFFI